MYRRNPPKPRPKPTGDSLGHNGITPYLREFLEWSAARNYSPRTIEIRDYNIRRFGLANLKLYDVDLANGTVMVRGGKGNKDRLIPRSANGPAPGSGDTSTACARATWSNRTEARSQEDVEKRFGISR